jgi:porin
MRNRPALLCLYIICCIVRPMRAQQVVAPNQPPTPGVTGDWNGERTRLAEDGLTIAAGTYFDASNNLVGGLNRSDTVTRQYTDLDITFTTDKLLHYNGGMFFFNFLDHQGSNGSTKLTGDIQGFDNQDAPGGGQVYQLFYQQTFADQHVRVKVGRIDLASSYGYSPAITSFPTYPDPPLAADIFWTPSDHWYLSGGIAASNRSDRFGILWGKPQVVRPNNGGAFVVTELGRKWTVGTDQLPGRLTIGGYYHTGTFPRQDRGEQTGAAGGYAVFDQTLWQTKDNRSIGLFAQYGNGDGNVNAMNHHLGAGMQWTGPIPSRATDVLGLGSSYVHLSDRGAFAESFELDVEGFYKLQLTPWFNVQPDLQYILHPSGRQRSDALVASLRLELDF